LYIEDCGCPAVVRDRYTVAIQSINPTDFTVFGEDIKKDLSAEEVKSYYQQYFQLGGKNGKL
jgi:hypothetical protein